MVIIILYLNNDNMKREDQIWNLKYAAGDIFNELEVLTNDFTTPEDACYSYMRTYELLDALEKDTFNHIHVETVLYLK